MIFNLRVMPPPRWTNPVRTDQLYFNYSNILNLYKILNKLNKNTLLIQNWNGGRKIYSRN